jgi:hypothetical protein
MMFTNRKLGRRLAGFVAGLGCVFFMTNLAWVSSLGHAMAFPGHHNLASSTMQASQAVASSFQEFAATHLEPNFYQ